MQEEKNFKFSKTSLSRDKNEGGQIAIFLALLFVVIFTLFGLTINISMVVHDKINLQNATDFSSYYVAQRQAEMLNAIAHTNYQMRQAWKLLAFRYRVIGTLGRKGNNNANPDHPALKSETDIAGLILDDNIFQPAYQGGACAAAPYFFRPLPESDYHCRNSSFSVNFIKAGGYSFGGIGGAAQVSGNIPNVNLTIGSSCDASTYFNWWYTTASFVAFRNDQKARRRVIKALAENLAKEIIPGPDGMKDLDGNSVYEGAFKTFQYNLSESNREFGDNNNNYELVFKNSIEGLNQQTWLPEITVDVSLPYSTFDVDGSGCRNGDLRIANLQPPIIFASSSAVALKAVLDPDDILQNEFGYSGDPSSPDSLSVGVEKNPWYMIYNSVQASVYSKPLFSPDREEGQAGIRISAISYAKPFGGRVGPWFSQFWQSGGTRSEGGGKTDPLYPSRTTGSVGSFNPEDINMRPNYSRFPSDKKGIVTNSAMVAAGRLIQGGVAGGPRPIHANELLSSYYSFYDSTPSADPLAQRLPPTTGAPAALEPYQSVLRDIEIAAVVPDAFDVTYYSIFPGFWDNFGSKLNTWLPAGVGLEANLKIRGDLGFIEGEGGTIGRFDIINQIEKSQQVQRDYLSPGSLYNRLKAPWLIKKNENNSYAYLSGWNSGLDVMSYVGTADTPNISDIGTRFAGCNNNIAYKSSGGNIDEPPPLNTVFTPGECLSGGRVGYSVKLISKSYLDSSHPNLGGAGRNGPILNAP